MKDSLKNFFKANREAFDDKVPSPAAWRKIESSLPAMKQVSIWNSVMLWRVAALLFMGLSVYLFVTPGNPAENKADADQLMGELSGIESYYSDEIAKKVALIDHFGGTFGKNQFTQDFQKLEAMYQVLRDEMMTRPTEKVKDALILNILVRIDLLNQQIKKLEESRESKAESAASV